MKNRHLLFIVFSILVSCKKDNLNENNDIKDSATAKIYIVDTLKENKIIDSEKLKKQEEQDRKEWLHHEKEISRIVKRYIIEKKSNDFIFKLFCEEQKNEIVNFKKIEVYKSNKLVQKLKTDSAYVYNKDEIYFELKEDVNFDGHKDLQLVNWVGMHDETYNFWLYDPKGNNFVFNKKLSEIMNPVFDKKSKEISSVYHVGPSEYHFETYKWKKGKLILVHEEIEGGDY